MWLRGQDPSSLWLCAVKPCGFAVKIPVGTPQVLWLRGQDPGWDTSSLWYRRRDPGWDPSSFGASWSGSLKFCGFAVKIPVGDTSSWWLRGQDPVWDTSSFVASRSGSRLAYLKLVLSWSRARLGHLKFCGFAANIPVGIPEVWW